MVHEFQYHSVFKSTTVLTYDTMVLCYSHGTFCKGNHIHIHGINIVLPGSSRNTMILPCLKTMANVLNDYTYKKYSTTMIFEYGILDIYIGSSIKKTKKNMVMNFSTMVLYILKYHSVSI